MCEIKMMMILNLYVLKSHRWTTTANK